jgi:hypothetical protein
LLSHQVLFCIMKICGRNEVKQTVKPLLFVISCVNTYYIEYPHSLYLLVLTVEVVSDTGTQIHLHLLVYLLMYRLHIIHVLHKKY